MTKLKLRSRSVSLFQCTLIQSRTKPFVCECGGGGGPLSGSDTDQAQWLSRRVLDSRPRGRGFEPHRRHCVVVLEQDTFILA